MPTIYRNTIFGKFVGMYPTRMYFSAILMLEQLEGSNTNHAKIVLADEATALLHGTDCLEQMHETVETMSKGEGESTDGLPRIFVTVSDFMGDGVHPCRSVYGIEISDK
jgi:tyrosyl-tRNA synthetase